MNANEKDSTSGRSQLLRFMPYLTLLAALVLVLFFFNKTTTDTIEQSGQELRKTIDLAAQRAAEVAARFHEGTINQTFTAAIPNLSRTTGGNLELAAAEATETFSKSDQKLVAWGMLNLGTTETEIRVPVTYRYHLKLHDRWELMVRSNICVVKCPPIRPTLPPAIHTDRLEKSSSAGWARFNAQAQMDELEKSITPALSRFASDPKHMNLVREECRKTVAEFVRDWLLREQQWQEGKFTAIKVIFPDETNATPEELPLTIRLKE